MRQSVFTIIFALSLTGSAIAQERNIHKQVRCNTDPEEQLKPFLAEFNLNQLPDPFIPPNITFKQSVQVGKLLYLSGNGPALPEGGFVTGKVPSELSVEEANKAARLTAINQLAVIKKAVGDLRRVKRIIKLVGMVNADSDFTSHPAVINGASDLLVAVFGECGFHARSAVGMSSLPFGIPVEIEMVVELKKRGSYRSNRTSNY